MINEGKILYIHEPKARKVMTDRNKEKYFLQKGITKKSYTMCSIDKTKEMPE